ncbi:MAG: hypothetical protein ACK4UL_02560 [Novosphingobium meiothermophilum]|nr:MULTISPECIES: hypothetical protein [Novosphingobium]
MVILFGAAAAALVARRRFGAPRQARAPRG